MATDPPELIDQHVAVRIHARRMEMGITLQALARQIGVAFQQAHKYERGHSRISAGRLYHVARALKVPVGFFFTSPDAANPADLGRSHCIDADQAFDSTVVVMGSGTAQSPIMAEEKK